MNINHSTKSIRNITLYSVGVGYPTYNSATNCTYVFDWDTKYACLEHPEDICRVDYNGRRYDLSTLTRDTGKRA